MRLRLAAALLVLGLPAVASAHPEAPAPVAAADYRWGESANPMYSQAILDAGVEEPSFEGGPCTAASRDSMPAAPGHDHQDPAQHRFACNMVETAYDSLKVELGERDDVILGEMDVKGDLAVVGVAYPESGFLLFDVSNPAQPGFLSWYRSAQCEGELADVDCGAFVDLSPDTQQVFISKQSITALQSADLSPGELITLPADYPGIEVVDISNRTRPLLRQALVTPSVGGVHTTRSFEVPAKGGAGPREAGTYTISVANSVGATINRVNAAGLLSPVGVIQMDELHDTFIQEDPTLGRTLLYIAGGFDSGFYVYDITAPSTPVALGEWDITPQCANDWYSHTIDVTTTAEGRRIVTMPVELIDFFGNQSTSDRSEGCGRLQGNGDHAGPLFIVDATDFSKLGPADPTDSEAEEIVGGTMRKRSADTLITSWSNAAGRAGGELTFTPHNQQIVGNKIYVSQYHAGVVVLDATDAFKGRNVRPKELAFAVPAGGEPRPLTPAAGGAYTEFFTTFSDYRPWLWDMQVHKGVVLAPDGTGGMHAFRETK